MIDTAFRRHPTTEVMDTRPGTVYDSTCGYWITDGTPPQANDRRYFN